jgi:hypothetical protein
MSELSVKEQEVLDFLINFIETEIFIIEEEEREKGRLDYSLCFNDDEKLIITKKKIKRFKSRIHDCNPVIAGYLNVLTSPYPCNFGYDELKLQITTNFLFSDYSELFEDLVNEDITDLENYQFKSVIKSMGYKYKNLKDFIQGICDVNGFLGYKSILEISNDPFPSSETNQHVVQDAEAIVYKNTPVALDQIDRKLWNWLQEFEKTNYYISTPLAMEEKRDYVTDTYFNYEERYYKYHLETCDVILEEVPGDKTIIEIRKQFQKQLIELRKAHPLPDFEIGKLFTKINSAFHLLEKFMDGSLSEYKSFLFNDYFTLLFNELSKSGNDIPEYLELKDGYFGLLNQISVDYDKSTFENQEAYSNEDFNRDCNEIEYLTWHRVSDFMPEHSEQIEIVKPSIMDLILNSKKGITSDNLKKKETITVNPYPRIFTSVKAFDKFKNLVEAFGNGDEKLADYSFVFHRMRKDKLIYDDYQQTQFLYFLLEFNINISRIKPKTQLGKSDLRESIYNRV